MAQLSKWAVFFKAFLVVFLSGAGVRSVVADEAEQQAWADAQRQCSADAFFTYLSRYPSGQHVEQALVALNDLGALQVAKGELSSSFCLGAVRELPPIVIPVQAKPTAPESSDDPY